MYSSFLIGMLIIDAISLVLFWLIQRNANHVTKGHIKIFGIKNTKLAHVQSFSFIKLLYFLTVIIFPACFYFLSLLQ